MTDAASVREIRQAADFRAALRRFLRESEKVVSRHELTDRQYLLLLMVAAAESDSEATIAAVAGRLQLAENTVSELADRAVGQGLLERGASASDRRAVRLRVTETGMQRLRAAVRALRGERQHLAEALAEATTSLARTGR